jgi:integrase
MSKHRTGYLFKRDGKYYLEYMVNGKRIKRSLKTGNQRKANRLRDKIMKPLEVAAEEEALRAVVQKLEATTEAKQALDEQTTPPLTVADAWDAYSRSTNRPDAGPATLKQYAYQFSEFAEWLGKHHAEAKRLRDVSRDIAIEFSEHLQSKELSANTFNKYIRLLDLVFRTLREKARLDRSPWEDIARKRATSEGRRELTTDELRAVCQAATGEMRTLFALGIYTGLRLGDCATLRWAEVDLIRRIIRRVPSKTARRNPKPVVVPIHPTLLAILKESHPRGKDEYLLPGMAKKYMTQPYALAVQLQDHFDACGIRTTKPGTGPDSCKKDDEGTPIPGTAKRAVVEVGFHSLRHTFVSMCREANAPLAVVEAIVGHSNPAMTRHYTHIGEAAAAQAIALLPRLSGDAKDGEVPIRKMAEDNEVLDALRTMTARNWRQIRDSLVASLSAKKSRKE